MDINIIAVIVGALAPMAIGAFWYSPAGLGKPWMKLISMTPEKVAIMKKQGMSGAYIKGFLNWVMAGLVIAWLLGATGGSGAGAGALIGLVGWLGFAATVTHGSAIWEGRSYKLWMINNSYTLLSFVVLGVILGAWM